jgi:hypothetical protein
MADLPPNSDRSQDTDTRPGMPRWVKVFGIIVIVLVLLFVISMLAGVRHGPGMHTPSGDAGGHIPPFSVMEDDTPSGSDFAGYTSPEAGYL